MRVFGVGFVSDEFGSPLEWAHDAIVVEHREMPLAFVHVPFQHRSRAGYSPAQKNYRPVEEAGTAGLAARPITCS